MERSREVEPLTEAQRKLVADNAGLVGVHLKHYVKTRRVPTKQRERADLFQEGCLGLIRAARSFRPERGIPFAAWALPRIHTAVSRALHCSFQTLRKPEPRRGKDRAGQRDPWPTPKLVALVYDPLIKTPTGHVPSLPPGVGDEAGPTIGERLRDKCDRALARARHGLSTRGPARPDRAALADAVFDERVSIPESSARTPLRALARRTRSSVARVSQCERNLREHAQRTLNADPEVAALVAEARRGDEGIAAPLDRDGEQRLAAAAGRKLVAVLDDLLQRSDAPALLALLQAVTEQVIKTATDALAKLAVTDREAVFLELAALRPRRRRPARARRAKSATDRPAGQPGVE